MSPPGSATSLISIATIATYASTLSTDSYINDIDKSKINDGFVEMCNHITMVETSRRDRFANMKQIAEASDRLCKGMKFSIDFPEQEKRSLKSIEDDEN
ncbi:hypothetical protein CSAL01_00283 [Colletotrichum salicis]|uniref:Uncharacterized protein n=1 Tax=Colletotrichum salicis TaxID=1209931 RepID=A0A135V6U8_9PEZI|nr:hypothetical protein CSAL01_00283 [Colletotrichum salicis]